MSNITDSPERNAPDPILPEPIGEDGFVQPREPDEAPAQGPDGDHPARRAREPRRAPEMPDQPMER